MIRTDSFLRCIAFAAAAAVGAVAWLVCMAPIMGGRRALGLWLVGLTASYVGGLAGRPYRRVAVAMVTAAVGVALFVVMPGLRELTLVLVVVLGVGRTVCVPRATPLRAVATEACLLAGGLAFAEIVGGPSVRGVALGVWGFFLVQSFFALMPAGGARARAAGAADSFEAAHARALALLER
jgi:hypothetical protein